MEGELPSDKEETIDEEEIIAEVSLEEGDEDDEATLSAVSCFSPPSTLNFQPQSRDLRYKF